MHRWKARRGFRGCRAIGGQYAALQFLTSKGKRVMRRASIDGWNDVGRLPAECSELYYLHLLLGGEMKKKIAIGIAFVVVTFAIWMVVRESAPMICQNALMGLWPQLRYAEVCVKAWWK